jgi:HPt (histidine-containing phosphotransfer) domain-containing protein
MARIAERESSYGSAFVHNDRRAQEAPPGGGARNEAAGGSAATEDDPSPIDQKALDMIASLQPPGEGSVLAKVVALYLDGSAKLMKSIRESAEGSDAEALHRAAHTLKSSSAYLGAATLSGMCKELEIMGRDKSLEGTEPRVAALEREYRKVSAFLRKRLEGTTPGGNPDH